MKTEYTAEQAASFLLSDAGLSEWQVGFLAVALDEVAEWHERMGKAGSIACHECADELTQMNSQHRGSIEPVVYALTGLSFSVSWRGDYGARTFFAKQMGAISHLAGTMIAYEAEGNGNLIQDMVPNPKLAMTQQSQGSKRPAKWPAALA